MKNEHRKMRSVDALRKTATKAGQTLLRFASLLLYLVSRATARAKHLSHSEQIRRAQVWSRSNVVVSNFRPNSYARCHDA